MSTVIAKNIQIGADTTATNNFTIYQPATPNGTLLIGNGNTGITSSLVTLTSAGNVGIGTSSPVGRLNIAAADTSNTVGSAGASFNITNTDIGAFGRTVNLNFTVGDGNLSTRRLAGISAIYTSFGTTTAGALAFATDNGSGSFTERMRLDSSGNLGLGVTPSAWDGRTAVQNGAASLASSSANRSVSEIWANGYVSSGGIVRYIYTANASLYQQASGIHTWLTAPSGTAGNAISFTQAMTLDASGNLLVGTTALNSTWTTPLTLSKNSGTTKWAVGPWVGGENSFIISTSGTGGVYLNGTAATSWSANSDETLKENLVPITNAAEKVCSLRAVIGNYIEDEEKTPHAFLIAQDVQAVLPEAVATTTRPDGTQVLGLAYTETIPLLVAAIKEQQAIITALQADVAVLKAAA